MFTKISVAALFAGLAAVAQAQTLTFDQSSNPITRPLNEVVPACKAFEITWTPTTDASEKVSINLLKGQTLTLQPAGTIVSGIANTGSYSWTPDASLEATTDATGWGLQLVIDSTGHFQYSTQFGISKADCEDEPSSTPSGYPTVTPSETNTAAPTPSEYAASSAPSANSTTFCTTTSKYVAPPSGYPYSTGAPVANSTVVLPSKSMTVPESLKPTATGTGSAPPESTGAASSLKAGLSLAGAVAGFVFML